MAHIPERVAENKFSKQILALGFPRVYQGKVGELFAVPLDPRKLLMMRTDRLSIFDFVLPCEVPYKGEVLMALTHFWLTQVMPSVPSHMLAWGANLELWKNYGWKPEEVIKLPLERTFLVEKCDVFPWEMVYRKHPGGSVWQQYLDIGCVAGIQLPEGLTKWEELRHPVFTPTTKEASGHDVPKTVERFLQETGDNGRNLMLFGRDIYLRGYFFAKQRGLAILDTKFELTHSDRIDSPMVLDEVLTPDSSRYSRVQDLEVALNEGRDPVFYDKEPVRIWGRAIVTPWSDELGLGLHKLDPQNPEHLKFIADLEVPSEVIEECSGRYFKLFSELTGCFLDAYQTQVMTIPKTN